MLFLKVSNKSIKGETVTWAKTESETVFTWTLFAQVCTRLRLAFALFGCCFYVFCAFIVLGRALNLFACMRVRRFGGCIRMHVSSCFSYGLVSSCACLLQNILRVVTTSEVSRVRVRNFELFIRWIQLWPDPQGLANVIHTPPAGGLRNGWPSGFHSFHSVLSMGNFFF